MPLGHGISRDDASYDDSYDSDVESGEQRSRERLFRKIKSFIRRYLGIFMLVGVITGDIIGSLCRLRVEKYSKREVMYAGYLGSLYMRMLQCTTFPLFTTSVITGFGNLNWKSSGKIGTRIFAFFVISTLSAVLIADALMLIFEPGRMIPQFSSVADAYIEGESTWNFLYDIIKNSIPSNLVEACMFMYKTEMRRPMSQFAEEDLTQDLVPIEVPIRATNYLGLIVAAMALGVSFSYMGEAVKVCLNVAEALNTLCIDLTYVLLHVSPIGMFCFAFSQTLDIDDVSLEFREMGVAAAFALVGQLIYILVILPLFYLALTRKNAFLLYYKLFPVVATAWATSSSIATMPVTLYVLERYVGLKYFTVILVVPLGANLHHAGGAISQIVYPWYIAQNTRAKLTFNQYVITSFVAMLASIASPGIPGGSLTAMRISAAYLGVLEGDIMGRAEQLHFVVDRFDTVVNIVGDCVAAAYLDHASKKQLQSVKHSKFNFFYTNFKL